MKYGFTRKDCGHTVLSNDKKKVAEAKKHPELVAIVPDDSHHKPAYRRAGLMQYKGKDSGTVPWKFVTKDSGERQKYATGAQRDVQEGKGRFDLLPAYCLKRLAQLYERGATKYGDNNWTKGIPTTRFASSALRHLFQYIAGERDEDHLAAVVFNVFGIIFTEKFKPEMHDLPTDARWETD